jgi:hypothetical protein
MLEQEVIEQKYNENKKEIVKIINDNNKIKILLNEEKIKFIITTGISYFKYISEYKCEDISKFLDILDNKEIENIYDYLVKSEYKIIEEEKKLVINNNKEIELKEKKFTDYEMINVLIEEIKEIKYKHKEEIETINKLNEEKDNQIKALENKYKELEEIINNDDKKQKIIMIIKNKKL